MAMFFRLKNTAITGIIACSLLCSSCYHVRITTSNFDPANTYKKERVDVLFWGIAQAKKGVIAKNCDSLGVNTLDEVRVTTYYPYALITVLTLGIWCPIRMEWKCPKPCPREGHL
jgi:hypothetical protein